jgi:Outer membrane protein beta-barrel domain
MKKILKVIGVALCLVAFTQNSNAQINVSAGLDLGFVLEEGQGLTYGLALGLEKPLGDNMGLTFQTGYDIISVEGDGASAALIPFQAGFKYYFMDNESGFYGHGQLGMTTYRVTVDLGGFGTVSGSSTNLSYAVGAGYLVSEHIDLGVRYNIVSGSEGTGIGYVALRAAYVF